MSPAFARLLDDATVFHLSITSWRDHRDVLADCAGCGRPFWRHARGATPQRYCDRACRQRAYWRRAHGAAA